MLPHKEQGQIEGCFDVWVGRSRYTFYCDWHNRTSMPPDVIVPPAADIDATGGDDDAVAGAGQLLWYHRNAGSR